MPSGDNWQSDVLRDLKGGAAQQRVPQPGAQPQQSAEQQAAGQQAQQAAGQQPGAQNVPPQGPPPAYGYPQQADPAQPQQPQPQQSQPQPQPQPPYGYPQQAAPAQPQQPYGYPQQGHGDQAAAYPQQGHPAQPQQPQQAYAQPQQAQPAQAPPQAPAPRARSPRATPDSRPVVDKKLASAGRGPRRGEPFSARALRAVRRTVSSSAAREVAETTATAEILQQPVTTGRQIAVTSIRGGSGKTTVAALLGTTYAHYRQDPTLVIEADPALGSLPLRLGAETLRWTTGDLADVVQPQMSLLEITGYLVQLPDNAWLLPGSQGQVGAMLDTKAYERVMVSMRRYFGVTVVDCETMPAEVARTALSAAQARILTVPATLEGVASTHAVLQWMRGLPRDITTSTVVVLTETVPHTGVDVEKAAEQLKSTGASVRILPYDRHLAAGGTIRTDLLARDTREAATRLAAEVFQLSQKSR
ncbi:MinD/ParA family protein [Streptomyces sp. NPDC058676]|uniref:MinD/ParA family ATP-binding protein n=1 Tax=unclassified Streptomyces TaxID=2593676 RepID=UPI003662A83B